MGGENQKKIPASSVTIPITDAEIDKFKVSELKDYLKKRGQKISNMKKQNSSQL